VAAAAAFLGIAGPGGLARRGNPILEAVATPGIGH
jgi:hypothetical protein